MKISVYDVTTDAVHKNKWSAYNCLVTEIEKDANTYILSMGQWRQVSSSFLQEVTDFISGISLSDPAYLPENVSIWNPKAKGGTNGKPFTGENQEFVYNKKAAKSSEKLFLFDKGKVEIAREKIYEVCDLYHQDRKFIQVKRFNVGSASVSHLFVQARFYGEAFLFDQKCRESMRTYIEQNANGKDVNYFTTCFPDDRAAIKAGEYYICLCLLTDKDNLQISDLPFMSKYELMITLRYLTNLGLQYEVIIRKVVFGSASKLPEDQLEKDAA